MLFAHSCIRMVHVTLQVQYIPYSREGVGFFFLAVLNYLNMTEGNIHLTQ